MDHHTNSPQHPVRLLLQTELTVPGRPKPHGSHQQSATTILWTKLPQKADCALWVILQTVHNINLIDHFDTNRADCGRKT